MEQSSFQGKLIRSAGDAAAIKVHSKEDQVIIADGCLFYGNYALMSTGDCRICVVTAGAVAFHSKEDPPDFRMRSTKVFAWVKRTAQTKAIFQVIIADGCLFYGNYALRSRGGCCICLLMASGLTAKRFSMWVADAEEGEIYYTISSTRFKLAVFIILPRVVNTMHQCVSQSEMDDNRSGHENTTKDFLTYAVRHLSRLYVGKTKGQEVCWKLRPPNWPENLTWKNLTSSPKDSTKELREKYDYLRSQVPNEKLSQREQNAFQNYEAGNTDNVKSFMCIKKWKDQINEMKNKCHCLQQPDLEWLDEELKLLKDKLTSLRSSSEASSSGRPTAADTSSSKKRKSDSLISVQSKQFKTEMSNCDNNIQNNSRKGTEILPTPKQPTSNEILTVFPQDIVLTQSSVVESPVRNTFANQSQQSLGSSNNTMSNTRIDIPKCTTLPDHPGTAAATNSLPSVVLNGVWGITNTSATEPLASSTVTPTHYNLSLGSHEQLSRTVSDSVITSLDSGICSQDSNISKEACDIQLDKLNLSHKVVQDGLQFIIENIPNTTDQNNDFDPSIFMNFDA